MHLDGRRRYRRSLRAVQAPGSVNASIGLMLSFLLPHGHKVSTTSKIRFVCVIFWTLNGLKITIFFKKVMQIVDFTIYIVKIEFEIVIKQQYKFFDIEQ